MADGSEAKPIQNISPSDVSITGDISKLPTNETLKPKTSECSSDLTENTTISPAVAEVTPNTNDNVDSTKSNTNTEELVKNSKQTSTPLTTEINKSFDVTSSSTAEVNSVREQIENGMPVDPTQESSNTRDTELNNHTSIISPKEGNSNISPMQIKSQSNAGSDNQAKTEEKEQVFDVNSDVHNTPSSQISPGDTNTQVNTEKDEQFDPKDKEKPSAIDSDVQDTSSLQISPATADEQSNTGKGEQLDPKEEEKPSDVSNSDLQNQPSSQITPATTDRQESSIQNTSLSETDTVTVSPKSSSDSKAMGVSKTERDDIVKEQGVDEPKQEKTERPEGIQSIVLSHTMEEETPSKTVVENGSKNSCPEGKTEESVASATATETRVPVQSDAKKNSDSQQNDKATGNSSSSPVNASEGSDICDTLDVKISIANGSNKDINLSESSKETSDDKDDDDVILIIKNTEENIEDSIAECQKSEYDDTKIAQRNSVTNGTNNECDTKKQEETVEDNDSVKESNGLVSNTDAVEEVVDNESTTNINKNEITMSEDIKPENELNQSVDGTRVMSECINSQGKGSDTQGTELGDTVSTDKQLVNEVEKIDNNNAAVSNTEGRDLFTEEPETKADDDDEDIDQVASANASPNTKDLSPEVEDMEGKLGDISDNEVAINEKNMNDSEDKEDIQSSYEKRDPLNEEDSTQQDSGIVQPDNNLEELDISTNEVLHKDISQQLENENNLPNNTSESTEQINNIEQQAEESNEECKKTG